MQKEKNKKIGLGIVGVLVLIATFYGGTVYGKSKMPARGTQAFMAGARGSRTGGNFAGAMGAGLGGGFTAGKIIAKDANSITVEIMSPMGATGTQTSGSKIILISNTTNITKSASGTLSDLAVGTQVSVTGQANSDGSINATTVQIRPTMAQPVVK